MGNVIDPVDVSQWLLGSECHLETIWDHEGLCGGSGFCVAIVGMLALVEYKCKGYVILG